jgi:putative ABC transport system permease protein
MFRNYLKTALRNLWRYKGFTAINILGLSLGITGCLVIGLFVWDEWQYDTSIPNGANIYRIYEERKDNNTITYNSSVPPAYTDFLKREYPEVVSVARIMMNEDKFLMEVGERKGYEEGGWFVDTSFLNFFSLQLKSGDATSALQAPQSVVISEEIARRYFGDSDPMGKLVAIDKDTFQVTGILAPLPSHFHLDFQYLRPMAATGIPAERMQSWGWHQFYSYVQLKGGASPLALQQKFQAHVRKEVLPTARHEGSSFLPLLQPLRDIHLRSSDFVYDNAVRGNETYVKGLSIIALFVLVIACFNFINLATARSLRRAREIGVRKVIGAGRRQLVLQFLGETILLALMATLIAVVATLLVLPALNAFTGKDIGFNPVASPLLLLLLLGGGLLVGVLAGIYPAMVLSGFRPVQVLKNSNPGMGARSWLRPTLVVVQFALSVLLIVSTLMVYRQTKFLNNKDLGFNRDQLVYFQVRGSVEEKLETFKSELRKGPGMVAVTSGYGLPGEAYAGDGITIPLGGSKEYSANVFIGDHDYVKALGLNIVAGRDFSRDMATDEREAFLVNETAVKEWGLGTPQAALGKPIHWNEWVPADSLNPVKKGRIVGVVKDFHYKSLHEKVTPSVIHIYPQVTYTVAARLREPQVKSSIDYISRVWESFSPGYPLDYKFMDETYGAMYRNEEKLSQLLWIFAIVAILVGCMGLFGLAAFSAEQRTKEIGIRKVLGASVFNIMGLLSKNFLLLILLSALLAFPFAWWAMKSWLDDFPYRVEISWWVFALAIVAALVIALITISFQSIRAATTNPVKSLRTE